MRLRNNHYHDINRLPRRRLGAYDIALAVGILIVTALIVAHIRQSAAIQLAGQAYVIDGDTLRIENQRVRLLGIDAPELEQTCEAGGHRYQCGREARKFLERLSRGHSSSCGGSDFDRYGRLLATCHAGGADLNASMVSAGWAVAYGGYHQEERKARENGKGMWAGRFDWPQDWRETGGIPPGRKRGFLAGLKRATDRLFGIAND